MSEFNKVHAEVEYSTDGTYLDVHSDICPKDCSSENLKDPVYKKFIHANLEEWLEKSNGTGCFHINNEKVIIFSSLKTPKDFEDAMDLIKEAFNEFLKNL